MLIKSVIYRKLVLLVAISGLLACHNREPPIPLPTTEDSTVRKEDPTPEPKYEYINEEGWQIPSSNSKHINEKKVISAKTASGKPVKINSLTYGLSQPILSQEPSKAVDKNREGTVRIWSFNELKANEKVFCYVLEAQPLSPKNNEGLGVKFFYRICDLNGDSKFETMYLGKKPLITPDWVTK
jgi:hypothetical protein